MVGTDFLGGPQKNSGLSEGNPYRWKSYRNQGGKMEWLGLSPDAWCFASRVSFITCECQRVCGHSFLILTSQQSSAALWFPARTTTICSSWSYCLGPFGSFRWLRMQLPDSWVWWYIVISSITLLMFFTDFLFMSRFNLWCWGLIFKIELIKTTLYIRLIHILYLMTAENHLWF